MAHLNETQFEGQSKERFNTLHEKVKAHLASLRIEFNADGKESDIAVLETLLDTTDALQSMLDDIYDDPCDGAVVRCASIYLPKHDKCRIVPAPNQCSCPRVECEDYEDESNASICNGHAHACPSFSREQLWDCELVPSAEECSCATIKCYGDHKDRYESCDAAGWVRDLAHERVHNGTKEFNDKKADNETVEFIEKFNNYSLTYEYARAVLECQIESIELSKEDLESFERFIKDLENLKQYAPRYRREGRFKESLSKWETIRKFSEIFLISSQPLLSG